MAFEQSPTAGHFAGPFGLSFKNGLRTFPGVSAGRRYRLGGPSADLPHTRTFSDFSATLLTLVSEGGQGPEQAP
ncbi:hypothetical protein [Roseibium sp.]|uniref:hypothetical protein n=1 Tax=Roseibium sp. TaxID=1936156 RepID=UPI003A97BE95